MGTMGTFSLFVLLFNEHNWKMKKEEMRKGFDVLAVHFGSQEENNKKSLRREVLTHE
jgi:hypothetical protein